MLLVTDTQVSRLHKAFANNSPANIKLSKTQLSKMVQLDEFLGIFPGISFFLNPDETIMD